ncbi:MAG TPA: L-serine ammonia-lyase, iron-sulfur-dependent subunit beta [Candidatus Limnocylindria bacterium]|nr:L-serine ammonia-lyase, iron-sulfur-dependent subunit beta [Candidatus Limnocylindria bacterium]
MKYRSVFDIIGPVMVGPSSSHTAGAVRIGRLARRLFGRLPEEADIGFFGSFARTWRGHATDVAVLAGVLGLSTSDPRIPQAYALAGDMGLRFAFTEEEAVPPHPNTVRIRLRAGNDAVDMTGVSLGGGMVQAVRVDGFDLRLSGEAPALLIFHRDAYGAVASVTGLLARERINISHMEVSRSERGRDALMVIETDQKVPAEVAALVRAQPNIFKTVVLDEEG